MNQDKIDPQLLEWLDELKSVPPRDRHAASSGRARFLGQAVSIQQAETKKNRSRKGGQSVFTRGERFALNVLVTILVIMGVLVSGTGTVYAAQDDLPDQPLYPVKLLTEDVRLGLANNPQTEIFLLTQMTQTRVNEMTQLAEMGVTPPAKVTERFSQQIQQMLQVAATMNDKDMQATLVKLQIHLQNQTQQMEKVKLKVKLNGATEAALDRVHFMLQEKIRLVDNGLNDPENFRAAVKEEKQTGQDKADKNPKPEKTPASVNGNSPGSNNGQGVGPQATPQGPDNNNGNNKNNNGNNGNNNSNNGNNGNNNNNGNNKDKDKDTGNNK
jgi:hypothetical protein